MLYVCHLFAFMLNKRFVAFMMIFNEIKIFLFFFIKIIRSSFCFRTQNEVESYKENLVRRIAEIFMIQPKDMTPAFLTLSEEPTAAARTQSHQQRSGFTILAVSGRLI